MVKLIGTNDEGHRVGEDHHRARYTDREVELMRQMRDSGATYREIAEKMECSLSLVYYACAHVIRAQTPTKFKKVTT